MQTTRLREPQSFSCAASKDKENNTNGAAKISIYALLRAAGRAFAKGAHVFEARVYIGVKA